VWDVRTPDGRSADQACGALWTQLAALERYYRVTTPQLIEHRASGTLPGCITPDEAARWAELMATLERLERRESGAESPPSA
jgi:hypothetical protein